MSFQFTVAHLSISALVSVKWGTERNYGEEKKEGKRYLEKACLGMKILIIHLIIFFAYTVYSVPIGSCGRRKWPNST